MVSWWRWASSLTSLDTDLSPLVSTLLTRWRSNKLRCWQEDQEDSETTEDSHEHILYDIVIPTVEHICWPFISMSLVIKYLILWKCLLMTLIVWHNNSQLSSIVTRPFDTIRWFLHHSTQLNSTLQFEPFKLTEEVRDWGHQFVLTGFYLADWLSPLIELFWSVHCSWVFIMFFISIIIIFGVEFAEGSRIIIYCYYMSWVAEWIDWLPTSI